MKSSRGTQLFALAIAVTGVAAANTCLAQQAAATPAQPVVVAQADANKDKPHNLSDTCWPGSAAAVMSAKYPPNARPGKPATYKDCR
jgi:hypothetical protein